ncbi:MAG TPA: hypothetical protein VG838_00685 [Opitutaceae bacterium]|nr:hypothetical protein [Opitutaceae bacterium]
MADNQTGAAKLYTTTRKDTPYQVMHRDPTRREKSGRAKRVVKWFADKDEAVKHRDKINEQLLTEGAVGVAFDAGLRGDAIAARRELDAKGHMGVSLLWLAQNHTATTAAAGLDRPIGPLVEAFLEHKEFAEGCSAQTVTNLETRVWAWIEREKIASLQDVRRENMESLRMRPGVSAHGRKNDMNAVSSFCTYLFDERKLITHHPLKGLKRPKTVTGGKKAIYTPEECEGLLKAARGYLKGKWLGTIVVMLFTGPRPSELKETHLTYGKQPLARIEGGKLRGRANRLVKLLPAATAWLRVAGSPAKVEPINAKARAQIMKLAGLKYSTDVLRHSFISYRLAITKNAGLVAIEAGTSEDVIFTNYHRPLPTGDGRRWEALRPGRQGLTGKKSRPR